MIYKVFLKGLQKRALRVDLGLLYILHKEERVQVLSAIQSTFRFLSLVAIGLSSFTMLYGATLSKDITLSKEQTLNIGISDNPPSLDPQRLEDTVSNRIGNDLYEGLMTESESGAIIPGIAERYETSDDGKVYTFYIRKNAKFSDGSPILASDVVFSFRRLVDPKTASTYSFIAHDIKNAEEITLGKKAPAELGVKEVDTKTVKVFLTTPTPYFTNLVAMTNFGIVKKSNVEKYKDSFTLPGNLISSGAYQLISWRLGDKVLAIKNPHYWNAKNTIIEKVNYRVISDGNSEIQMYKAGQIDFTFNVPSDKVPTLRKEMPDQLKISPQLAIYYLDFNLRKEPFKNNKKLRQALSMAINREVLTDKILARGETPAYDLIPKGTANYEQQNYAWSTWSDKKRVEEAKKLFKESGYSDNNPLKISISYNTDVTHKKIIIAVASMWQKTFGRDELQVSLQNEEWKVFLKSRQLGDFLIARQGWVADYNDASTFANILVSKYPQNTSGYSSSKYDSLQKDATSEENVLKREEIFEEGMKLALEDYPIMPLYNYVDVHLVKPYVAGYTGKNPLGHIYTRDLYKIDIEPEDS